MKTKPMTMLLAMLAGWLKKQNNTKPLADYVHKKGLKFGIHIMRGIPRQAVLANSPVLGTKVGAADIADTENNCGWLNHMHGVDMSKERAQAYYDSLFKLYAEWEVDFVKMDDVLWHGPYQKEEIKAARKAIVKCGRAMVLSLSPGPAQLENARHVQKYSDMWRISDDFFDTWKQLKEELTLCRNWAKYSGPGQWADADMLPLGWIADVPGSKDKCLALFNLSDAKEAQHVPVTIAELGFTGKCRIKDLWNHKVVGVYETQFSPVIPPHGAGLYRFSPK